MLHRCKRLLRVLIVQRSLQRKTQMQQKSKIKRCRHIFLVWTKSDSIRKKKTIHLSSNSQRHQQVAEVVADTRDHPLEICLRKVPIESSIADIAKKIKNLIKKRGLGGLGAYIASGINKAIAKNL